MKILQINNYHYLRGGSEKVYFETSRVLQDAGHKVIHFSILEESIEESPTKNYFVKNPDFLNVSTLKKIVSIPRFFYSKESAKNLEKLLKKEKPDIAHLHIFYSRLTSSILPILKRYNIPTVMTVHEYKMLCPAYLFLNSKNEICEKCATGNVLSAISNKCNKGSVLYSIISAFESKFRDIFFPYEKYIDHFIMVSDFIQKKHLEYKPSLKSSVINNFVETREEPNYKMGDYYLYFGRISEEKGVGKLLEFWREIPEKLVVIGDGDFKSELPQLQNVEFLGSRFGVELQEYISNSKFVIFPSIVYETFGLGILEAYSLGKPVIASDFGNYPNLVNSETGFLVSGFEKDKFLEKFQSSREVEEKEYLKMSKRAFEISKQFNEEKYLNELIKVYKNVLSPFI
jgi:glycosyltransferase involved in cell wall biosynthesis